MYNVLKRIYVDENIDSDRISFSDKDKIHHIVNVLRLKKNDEVLIFNGDSGEFLATIEEISGKSKMTLAIIKKTKEPYEDNCITIAFSPIKQDRLRFLIEKCTEIGCKDFIPVITERAIIRDINDEKLKSYIIGASEQSGRISVPVMRDKVTLISLLNQTKNQIIFCDELDDIHLISKMSFDKKDLVILIGPEGGFTTKERELLTKNQNVISVSLGKNILRSETAAIFALSCLISK